MKPQPPKRPPKKLSLASEVLDAEVTAITNSGGSSGPDEEEEEEVDSMKKVGPDLLDGSYKMQSGVATHS